MEKVSVSKSGIYTIREYRLDREADPAALVKRLQAGPGEVREVICYVFEGEDPLGLDARAFSPDEFAGLMPQLGAYGQGLAFDVILRADGLPVTVELTNRSRAAAVNSLDQELELWDLLGPEEASPSGEEELSPQALLEILSVAERLKCATRHCDTSSGRRESVAEHSWRVSLMAMLLSGQEEYADVSIDRVIRMCLIHDLGEAFTGDIPTFEKTSGNEKEEARLLAEWVDTFPQSLREEFRALYAEMDLMQTPEARLYKALDKMEAVIQHNEADISTWLPLEYGLQRTYGEKEVQFSPFLRKLKAVVDDWTERKIAAAGGAPAGTAQEPSS